MRRAALFLVLASALGLAFAAAIGAPGARSADLPDVTSRGGLRIGSVLVPWGTAAAVDLRAADAIQSGAQGCAFHATYEMTNLGGVATVPSFVNRLRVDGANVVATNAGLALSSHETKSVTTEPYLPVGEHTLELSLDDDGNVAESSETNNRVKVAYRLRAPCGASAPATPAPRKPGPR